MSSESMVKACNEAQDGVKDMEESLSPTHDIIQTSEDGLVKVQEMQTGNGKRRFTKSRGRRLGARPVDGVHKSIPRNQLLWSCRDQEREKHEEEIQGAGPFFFIGGVNGAEIVSTYCEKRGWKRIYNKNRDDFKLKWCETKSAFNYLNFREGEQLVYQIPNNKVLTTKIGLLSSLREYERVSSKVNHGQAHRRLKLEDFIPTTFRMDVKEEREAFFAQQEGVSNKYGHMWICKPTGLNQGRGIFLLKSLEDIAALKAKLQYIEDQHTLKTLPCRPHAHVVQHYIQRPLLLKGKKFDVRSYLMIACTSNYMVFFHHGYVRLTCDLYDPSSNNLSTHLTNQYMQKKNPRYSQVKEDTVWSMESFNVYVNDRFQAAKGLPRDWVLGAFTRRMQQIMRHCFFAVKSKLDRRLGLFDLIGCDFMVDEDFKVWLLEMNCNPALHVNCEVLRAVIPPTVVETLDVTLEIFHKCRLRQRILPLASLRDFVLLYDGHDGSHSAVAYRKSHAGGRSDRKVTKKSQPQSSVGGASDGNTVSNENSSPVERKPNTCTLQHPSKHADVMKQTLTQQAAHPGHVTDLPGTSTQDRRDCEDDTEKHSKEQKERDTQTNV
uniref:protein polyglycylase TTLL10 n=1 Tax=Doryrhamphus excisus TaxID=161450 RepID=UPI0025AE25B9|nr:protein polyglycylase TTLL10 [Doryrhamphus excisus]